MKHEHPLKPSVIFLGGGAAGLWTAMALLDKGWNGKDLTIVEPSGKTEDDRTWSYWAKRSLLPASIEELSFSKITLASDGKSSTYNLGEYGYYSLRSSSFYAYAKEVLAKAGVSWIRQAANSFSENAGNVDVALTDGTRISACYVLDSRPPEVEMPSVKFNATLQHFGGWFVKMPSAVFKPDEVTFMDFISIKDGVAFFYVIPSNETEALVEIAVFSDSPWDKAAYDEKISAYILEKYDSAVSVVLEREYGVIPMTDQPLWKGNTKRVWNIGTRGGWVQSSSGYAFSRTARFAEEVAELLTHASPTPWKPSTSQQVFNSVMLGYLIDNPEKAGSVFFDLFAKNGPKRTFDFLDEASDFGQIIRLMWNSPQLPFAIRAIKEVAARVKGAK